eukprot:TRINITY_DN14607_c0_g1_i3.p1 TRINITY_DN14607_c0_g1~~TRINITY_DN14607_c0_g1_i3.p1  ORF type:complete len:343 (+),score=84.66 TRINITY_DN14607_c0_g1_i3:34-1029(+)
MAADSAIAALLPPAAEGRSRLVAATAAVGVSYALLSQGSGTWRPGLNVWFASSLVREYLAGVLSPEARAGGLRGILRAASGRLETLRRVLRLEVDHQRKIIEAGGPAAVAADPTRLWRAGLLHVRTARQADQAAKKSGGGGMAMGSSGPILRDLVLVGGGHSHAHVLLMLGMEPQPGVRVTLITRDMETPYSGMLPGHVAGHYTKEECHIDLAKLGRFANARVVHAEVTGIDIEAQRVQLRSCLDGGERPSIRYDAISVDVGCSPSTCEGMSGYDAARSGADTAQGVATVKPIDRFSEKFERLVAGVESWQAASSADLGGSSKYSNENFED